MKQVLASSSSSDVQFDVQWRPFQLNEDTPPGKGVDKMAYYHERFGADRIAQMIPYMKQVGESHGIKFSYGGHIGNTFDSHRLIWYARQVGGSELQDKMVEALFSAYFEQELSLGERSVLKSCAEKAGMSTADKEAVLEENSAIGAQEVKREMRQFRSKWRCTGVPMFIVDGQHTFSGAQPAEAFVPILKELIDAAEEDNE
mmetsp:Transcript_25162/g.35444  ORF Transcript_25162/g.35444 Transcript_25162/m.35444 type:complete len:201 (+) Transcript_25162:251-853(+)